MALVIGAAGVIGTMTVQQSRLAKKKRQDVEFGIQIQSGIETMLLAYRISEIKYIKAISDYSTAHPDICSSAKPFLQALKEGSACSGFSLTLFEHGAGKDDDKYSDLFNFSSGATCTISETSSTCGASLNKELVNVGFDNPGQKIQGAAYKYYLTTIFPQKSLVEFAVVTKIDGANYDLKRSFAIRPILSNAAHMEADSRVTQENPDPLARCPGSAWATFQFFHPTQQNCQSFVQLGGGTGLAYYKNRYFGFRPADGQVIDLLLATDSDTPDSYLVTEAGTIGGKPYFPAYAKSNLFNTDDITVVGDQVYYVAYSGTSARIGFANPDANGSNTTLCPLGEMGWAQAYSGIAALSWSDPLLPQPTVPGEQKLAVFFLKSDTGDLFTVAVLSTKDGFSCSVFKDGNLQQVEYKRTNGFDRTSDSKPYYIY